LTLFKETKKEKLKLMIEKQLSVSIEQSARNGNVEVPVYFLKAKQGYTVRKIEEGKLI
jgi:hypothetical protein